MGASAVLFVPKEANQVKVQCFKKDGAHKNWIHEMKEKKCAETDMMVFPIYICCHITAYTTPLH